MHGLHIQPQVDELDHGGIQMRHQQGFSQLVQVDSLQMLSVHSEGLDT